MQDCHVTAAERVPVSVSGEFPRAPAKALLLPDPQLTSDAEAQECQRVVRTQALCLGREVLSQEKKNHFVIY